MAKQIIWTPEAEETLDGVVNYLLENWSNKDAKKFLERVSIVLEHIRRHPLAFRSGGKEDIREALITKHNLLIYRVSGEIIYLLYVWDTRRNPEQKPEFS